MITILCLLLGGVLGAADSLVVAPPAQVGLGKERLDRIRPAMEKNIAANRVAGAIGLIARKGKIGYFETYGMRDKENAKPMQKDSLFRIYSMTKPVTGVAVMMLFEEGKFQLNDPVSKYLPEFKDLKVGAEPAKNTMTIRDLLRHTSGLSYSGPDGAYAKLRVMDPAIDLSEFIRRLAQAPLHREPGTGYQYSVGMDVLGRIVEVTSDMTLDRFFEERIFKPLGMKDTAFFVPEAKRDRLAVLYAPDNDRVLTRSTSRAQDSYFKRPTLLFGGAGLVSTAMDYARFCQMLLNGGQLDGVRLLGRKTVELMSSDHLGDIPISGGLAPGYGFGLTMAVSRGPGVTGTPGSAGEFNWSGAAGTRFWIDPKEQMFGVFMVQIMPYANLPYAMEFRQLAYQAIVD